MRSPVRVPARASPKATGRGTQRRASKNKSKQVTGRRKAVGARNTSSVLPNVCPRKRSRKYHPAGNGAPTCLRLNHQLLASEMSKARHCSLNQKASEIILHMESTTTLGTRMVTATATGVVRAGRRDLERRKRRARSLRAFGLVPES